MADSRPEPGPCDAYVDRTQTVVARCGGCVRRLPAAPRTGVPLREPRKPSEPELFQLSVLPCWSVIVTMVLLNDA